MHLLCGDTVPKYRAENGAGEEGTLRTINIHSPWMENAPVQEGFSSSPTNAEYGVKDGSAFMLRLIRHGHNAALDVPVPF